VSDIDLALILADPVQPSDGDAIQAIAETQKRAGRIWLSAYRFSGEHR
jgi:hypothetical protein